MFINETLNGILLVCAALIPAIVLCIYIFKKDSVEKEPIVLLLSLFALGCAICYPAAEIESTIIKLLTNQYKAKPNGAIKAIITVIIGIIYVIFLLIASTISVSRTLHTLHLRYLSPRNVQLE